jgi:hypothetical protein
VVLFALFGFGLSNNGLNSGGCFLQEVESWWFSETFSLVFSVRVSATTVDVESSCFLTSCVLGSLEKERRNLCLPFTGLARSLAWIIFRERGVSTPHWPQMSLAQGGIILMMDSFCINSPFFEGICNLLQVYLRYWSHLLTRT